jgi:hypothetical protein
MTPSVMLQVIALVSVLLFTDCEVVPSKTVPWEDMGLPVEEGVLNVLGGHCPTTNKGYYAFNPIFQIENSTQLIAEIDLNTFNATGRQMWFPTDNYYYDLFAFVVDSVRCDRAYVLWGNVDGIAPIITVTPIVLPTFEMLPSISKAGTTSVPTASIDAKNNRLYIFTHFFLKLQVIAIDLTNNTIINRQTFFEYPVSYPTLVERNGIMYAELTNVLVQQYTAIRLDTLELDSCIINFKGTGRFVHCKSEGDILVCAGSYLAVGSISSCSLGHGVGVFGFQRVFEIDVNAGVITLQGKEFKQFNLTSLESISSRTTNTMAISDYYRVNNDYLQSVSDVGVSALRTTVCDQGTYISVNDQSFYPVVTCKDCSAGTYAEIGDNKCSKCRKGSASDQPRSASCPACLPGTFADSEGKSSCSVCPAGTFAESQSLTCTKCPKGTFAEFEKSASCTGCSPGTFAQAEGYPKCDQCSRGFYQPNGNGTSCLSCIVSSKPGSDTCGLGDNWFIGIMVASVMVVALVLLAVGGALYVLITKRKQSYDQLA